MDIQLEKIRIMQHLAKIDEEWMLIAIKRIMGIKEDEIDDEFVKGYEKN